VDRKPFGRQTDRQSLKDGRDLGSSETEVPMAALLGDIQSSSIDQPPQMLTGSGCRHARVVGQLTGGAKAPIQKVETQGYSGVISEEPGRGDHARLTILASHVNDYRSQTELCASLVNTSVDAEVWVFLDAHSSHWGTQLSWSTSGFILLGDVVTRSLTPVGDARPCTLG